jgi:ribosomal protein L37AE/L43A
MEQGFSIWAKGLRAVLLVCSIVPYIYIYIFSCELLDKVKYFKKSCFLDLFGRFMYSLEQWNRVQFIRLSRCYYYIFFQFALWNKGAIMEQTDGTLDKVNQIQHTKTCCHVCGEDVASGRWDLGYRVCLACGDVKAKARKFCVVPMHKSNYVAVFDRELLTGVNQKGGIVK